MADLRRLAPWVLRAAWALQPLVAGRAFADALDPTSGPVRTTASVGLWAAWAAVLLATLLPSTPTLTAVRVVAPAAVPAALWAAATGRPGPVAGALAVAAALVAALVALSSPVGRSFVQAGAYGDERRHLLRAPGALLLGPLQLAWALAVGAPVAVALLLASRSWVAAGVVAVLGLPAGAVAVRSLHGLTERWIVFVPAGVVVKDPLTLVDPVLVRRQEVESLGPAPAGTDSLDLTMGAPGLALELRCTEKVRMTLVKPSERGVEAGSSARFLVTPTRPGAVLADAAERRFAVG